MQGTGRRNGPAEHYRFREFLRRVLGEPLARGIDFLDDV
jgi:hypothetical protein